MPKADKWLQVRIPQELKEKVRKKLEKDPRYVSMGHLVKFMLEKYVKEKE